MNSQLKGLQKTLAAIGVTGAAALMALPVLAQSSSTSSGVLNPNPSIFNEAPYNRTTTDQTINNQPAVNNQTSTQCSYVNGGVGGPVDSQAGATPNQGVTSSDDLAATGVPGSTNSDTNQFPNESNIGNVGQRVDNQSVIGSTTYGNSSSMNTRSANVANRQFDANNPSAAVAFRSNGPAATAGHEAKMNLDAIENRESSAPMASNSSMMNSSQSNSTTTTAPLATTCAPR